MIDSWQEIRKEAKKEGTRVRLDHLMLEGKIRFIILQSFWKGERENSFGGTGPEQVQLWWSDWSLAVSRHFSKYGLLQTAQVLKLTVHFKIQLHWDPNKSLFSTALEILSTTTPKKTPYDAIGTLKTVAVQLERCVSGTHFFAARIRNSLTFKGEPRRRRGGCCCTELVLRLEQRAFPKSPIHPPAHSTWAEDTWKKTLKMIHQFHVQRNLEPENMGLPNSDSVECQQLLQKHRRNPGTCFSVPFPINPSAHQRHHPTGCGSG